MVGIAAHKNSSDHVRESRDLAEVRLTIKRNRYMKSFRAGSLDPTRQTELSQQIPQVQSSFDQRSEVIFFRRIEIEDAQVGVAEGRYS